MVDKPPPSITFFSNTPGHRKGVTLGNGQLAINQADGVLETQTPSGVPRETRLDMIQPLATTIAFSGYGGLVSGSIQSALQQLWDLKATSGANTDITSLAGLTTPLAVGQGGTGANTATGARSSLSAAASGANSDISSLVGLTTALTIAQGGTGAITASAARASLSAAVSGVNGDITSLTSLTTALSLAQGGTGANTATTARTSLGLGSLATLNSVNNTNWSGTALALANGGTGATAAPAARTALGAAASGANSDITALSGLTTALSVPQGGTGGTTAATARSGIGAAASGTNSDITSLTGLTTALSIAQGGTGATSASGALTSLGAQAALTFAAASDVRTGTDTAKPVTSAALMGAAAFVTDTWAATLAPDFSTGFNRVVTLGGNTTFGQPTNMKDGEPIVYRIIQDGTGSRTIAFSTTYWKFPGGTVPTASTTAGAIDRLTAIIVNRSGTLVCEVFGYDKDIK